ncbi:hypothetical protein HHK36_028078 [Tetracentron sinense]|uniref:Hyaluronan/mRNA-binding protein domain-containing protein n=1 Tax=Tetracentron sinense TaxID=13715 RepID=A0A835D244_TETSI|nr:hypothetical protein HHK36_028078 [Tetracentron sinense]
MEPNLLPLKIGLLYYLFSLFCLFILSFIFLILGLVSRVVREGKNEAGRGGGRGGGRGYGRGRGGGGFNRDPINNENTFSSNGVSGGYGAAEEGDTGKPLERRGYGGPRGPFRGGRHGGFSNGEAGDEERPRRVFERRSGTGRGNEIKREGSGRGNWGNHTEEIVQETEEPVNENEKSLSNEKPSGEEEAVEANKEETPANEPEEKEPENKEMTLEEYQKVLEEKRKALQALKTEERKVDLDKDFESMQQISSKKGNDEIFIKLGSEKDKRKEIADKEEKAKKVRLILTEQSLSINEFLKPAEGNKYSPGGRGRGRGRGSRGGFGGGSIMNNVAAPSIEDPGQFPTLGAK